MSDSEPAPVELSDPSLFINRELSLLEFQRRVLEEAFDATNPLLERAKFLAILSSNMDEFFMVRVAGIWHQIDAGVNELSTDGLTPNEQLAAIRKVALELMTQARDCLHQQIMPALAAEGIHLLEYAQLTDAEKATTRAFFERNIFAVLTPLAFDPGRPFPHISNLSLNLAVLVRDPKGHESFARLKVPDSFPRLLPVPAPSDNGPSPRAQRFVWLEQVIAANLDLLFPGMEVVEAHPFRVTRDADTEIQEAEADDLLETMERSVRLRRFGAVLRTTTERAMPPDLREILVENLELDPIDLYVVDGPIGLGGLMSLYRLDRPDLKDPPFVPAVPRTLDDDEHDGDLFAAIRQQDVMLHHPYDTFAPVIGFLRQAACDPNVLAIKMTLYRVGRDAPVVEALLEAVNHGKQVAVLVELKARFDEESNITWARKLEQEGVHVVYGLLGLKTHSKVALVVRREGAGVRRYVHLSTGNYNVVTAQVYTDIGLFTCDDAIGADASDLFNYLTGYSRKHDYRKLLVAPINLRGRMEELILREMKHGSQGHLVFKMNALVDPAIIRLLYRASQAGVRVDLLVRGVCCLRPGLPGVSENIRVTSIVGRFLEHSRIFYFHNGGEEEVFLGSADLMPRNMDRRVEVLFPVETPGLIRYLRDEVLATYLADNAKARILKPDATYEFVESHGNGTALNGQALLLHRARAAGG